MPSNGVGASSARRPPDDDHGASTRPAVETHDDACGLWGRLLVPALVILLACLYVPVFRDLVAVWSGDAYASPGFLILIWSVWLAWGARATVRRAPRRSEPAALAIVAAALALLALAHARGSLGLAVLSLPVALAGLGRFALGRAAFRPLTFPTAFLALMTPLPPELIPRLSLPLQQLAASFSHAALSALNVPHVRDGLFIRLDTVTVHVAEGCSGLRFLLVMVVLGVGSAWAIERRTPLRLAIFALAVVAAIGANLVRVAGTVFLVHVYGPTAATGPVHGLFGKALYLVALVLFLLAVRGLRGRRPPRRDTAPGEILTGSHDLPATQA